MKYKNIDFKYRLREALDDKKMTNKELAKRTGVSIASVSNYLSFALDTLPTSHNLRLIADVLDVSTDYLLGLSNCKEIRY